MSESIQPSKQTRQFWHLTLQWREYHQQAHLQTRAPRGSFQRKRPRYFTLVSTFSGSIASNLIDNSFVVTKESPGALHNKLGALASAPRQENLPQPAPASTHQETRCQGPCRFSPGQRPEIVRRGPTPVLTMIAGFKEHTQNGHARSAKNNFDVVGLRMWYSPVRFP